jgi:hypothetical protein
MAIQRGKRSYYTAMDIAELMGQAFDDVHKTIYKVRYPPELTLTDQEIPWIIDDADGGLCVSCELIDKFTSSKLKWEDFPKFLAKRGQITAP